MRASTTTNGGTTHRYSCAPSVEPRLNYAEERYRETENTFHASAPRAEPWSAIAFSRRKVRVLGRRSETTRVCSGADSERSRYPINRFEISRALSWRNAAPAVELTNASS